MPWPPISANTGSAVAAESGVVDFMDTFSSTARCHSVEAGEQVEQHGHARAGRSHPGRRARPAPAPATRPRKASTPAPPAAASLTPTAAQPAHPLRGHLRLARLAQLAVEQAQVIDTVDLIVGQ